MGIFMRTLWGGDVRHGRWAKLLLTDIRKARVHSVGHQYVYCYGKTNANFITKENLGTAVLCHDDPFPDGLIDRTRSIDGNIIRPWHYKWQLIRKALEDHGEVIYADWDVFCRRTDHAYAFSQLAGREFTLSANVYQRPQQMPWRASARRARCFNVSGNWLHCKGFYWADLVLGRMDPNSDEMFWHDERTMSKLIDERHPDQLDGWHGDKVWLERYESPIMVQKMSRTYWPLVSDDGQFIIRDTPVPFQWERVFVSR